LKKIAIHIIIYLLCVIYFPLFATQQQEFDNTTNKIDSLESLLPSANQENKLEISLDLAKLYNGISPQQTIDYGLKAVDLAVKLKDKDNEATAYYITGIGYFYLRETNKSLDCFNKALKIREETGNKKEIAKSLKGLGIIHTNLGNNSKALNYFLQSLKLFKELGVENEVANAQMDIARIYANLGFYEKALEFNFQAIKTHEQLENSKIVADIIMNTGIIYFELENYEKAIEYYNKALELFLAEKSNIGMAMVYNNIGIVYQLLNKNDIALEYSQRSLKISQENDFWSEISSALINIGLIYESTGDYFRSLENFQKTLDLEKKAGNKTEIANIYNNIGRVYFKLNDNKNAIIYLNKGLKLSKEVNTKYLLKNSYEDLFKFYASTGDYNKFLEYFDLHSALQDSIFNEERKKRIAEAEVLYETEKKENSIQLLTKEKELQNLQLDKQKTFRNFLIALSVLILALAIIIYSRFILKRKANTLLEDKNNDLARKNIQIEKQNIKIEAQSEKLQELDEAKSRFFANISHEFRTPLMLIKGPLSDFMAAKKAELTAQEFTNLSLSLRNADKLKQLIDQLLDLSKLESGNLLLHTSKTNIVPFIKRVIDSFASAGKKITIIFNSASNNIPIYFDAEKMETVITNLLSNAYKFTPENEHITISISTEKNDETAQGSFVMVSIADTGLGINKESLPFIFDRFYQADDSSVRKYEGTGIGLAITKELIELHGGTISVESKPDVGTTFIVHLPIGKDHLLSNEIIDIQDTVVPIKPKVISEYDISSTQEIVDKNVETKGSSILVVEDNFDMRNYIVGHISENYNIIEAVNGKEGLRKVIEHIPDLIISDLMMPEMDGVQFLKEIRNNSKTKDIPFILLTARAGEQDRIAGLKAKANDYLTKPFSPEELKTRIHNILETRQNLEEKFSQKILSIEFDNPELVSADSEFLQKMRDTVIEDISDPSFSINNLIDKAFLSERQLRRRIKELTGLSPVEFIRQIRLLQAKELLHKHAFNSVAEISVAVGFNNPHYFSRLFKNMFGKSPGDMMV